MMHPEQLPAMLLATIRDLFREVWIELRFAAVGDALNVHDAGELLAAARLLLSQIALVVSIVLAAFIIYIVLQRRALKTRTEENAPAVSGSAEPLPVPTGVLRDRWNAILAHLDSVREADWKLAVIEADTLVDDALARAGFPGATFGDRLSNIQPGTLLSLDGIWWAHKVRNRLAHEVDYFLRYTEARQAVGYFEAALSELQLI